VSKYYAWKHHSGVASLNIKVPVRQQLILMFYQIDVLRIAYVLESLP
jgi:hypothetical protein